LKKVTEFEQTDSQCFLAWIKCTIISLWPHGVCVRPE